MFESSLIPRLHGRRRTQPGNKAIMYHDAWVCQRGLPQSTIPSLILLPPYALAIGCNGFYGSLHPASGQKLEPGFQNGRPSLVPRPLLFSMGRSLGTRLGQPGNEAIPCTLSGACETSVHLCALAIGCNGFYGNFVFYRN